jgi:hypothetical protein
VPPTFYKIWSVGRPVGGGVTNSIYVGVSGIAKAASADLPYVVVNELICADLARALLLPVPPGFLIEHATKPHYVSLNFNLSGAGLPPADPVALVAAHPHLALGIVLFDVWIANKDRHRSNIAFDTVLNKVMIFDHSHALYGESGRARLEALGDDLGIASHCVASELTNLGGVASWIERISLVPEFYIRSAVGDAVAVGLPAGEVDFLIDFLLRRREQLLVLLRAKRSAFPKVEPLLWDEIDSRAADAGSGDDGAGASGGSSEAAQPDTTGAKP